MRSLNATEMLDVWEHGLNQPNLQRGLILLAAASPELDPDAVAKLSIGVRDTRLLQLREWMFGSNLNNTALCPQCGERVEWEGNTRDFIKHALVEDDAVEEYDLEMDNYHVRFRLPNSLDMVSIMGLAESDNSNANNKLATQALLERCIITNESSSNVGDLPDNVLDALSGKIEALDPLAVISTTLTCPECSHQWVSLFDIASFLWAEINAWAERTLLTIKQLASAFGWTESEILGLSPFRRQLYLEMVE